MSIVNVTAYPSKYAEPPYQDAEELERLKEKRREHLAQARKGKLYIVFASGHQNAHTAGHNGGNVV